MRTYAGVRVAGVLAAAPVSASLYCATKNYLWAKGGCAQCGAPFAGIIRNRFSGSRAACPPLSLDHQAPRKYWPEYSSRAGACQSWRLNLVTEKFKCPLCAAQKCAPNFLLSLSGLELSYRASRGPTIKMPRICLPLIAPARAIKVHCAVCKVGYLSVTVLFPRSV